MAVDLVSDRARDRERESGTGNGHVPLIRGYQAIARKLQYATSLGAAYSGIELPDPSTALASDADAYEVCLRDMKFQQLDEIRRRAAAAKTWRLQPGDGSPEAELLAMVLTDLGNQCKKFYDGRMGLAQAFIIGSAHAYMEGSRRFMTAGGREADWWAPTRLTDIDRRRIAYRRPVGGGRHVPHLWSRKKRNWVQIPESWPLITIVNNNTEKRLGHGRGPIDAIMPNVYMKAGLKSLAGMCIDAQGRGILRAGINSLRQGSDDAATQDLITAWTEVLEAVRAGANVVVHDKEDEFAIETPGEHASAEIRSWCQEINDEMAALMLGASAPFGGNAGDHGGSRAKANTESDVHEELMQADRSMLADELADQFFGRIRFYNRYQLAEMGIGPWVAAPAVLLESETQNDPTERLEAAAAVQDLGGDLMTEEVYEGAGYTVPPGMPAVMKPPAQPEPGGMPGMPGMPGLGPDFNDGKPASQGAGEGPATDGVAAESDGTFPEAFRRLKFQRSAITVAGLCVLAADTGRVLMLQRALDEDDGAAGKWEFPGGHLDDGEGPLAAAKREWQEETGCALPAGKAAGAWRSANGVYKGFVYLVPDESAIDIHDGREWADFTNPDDPDGDLIESVAWWNPADMRQNPALRLELADEIGPVISAINKAVAAARKMGRWVTIGAHEDEDGEKKGGTPVYIENGKITKGPAGTTGNSPSDPRGRKSNPSSGPSGASTPVDAPGGKPAGPQRGVDSRPDTGGAQDRPDAQGAPAQQTPEPAQPAAVAGQPDQPAAGEQGQPHPTKTPEAVQAVRDQIQQDVAESADQVAGDAQVSRWTASIATGIVSGLAGVAIVAAGPLAGTAAGLAVAGMWAAGTGWSVSELLFSDEAVGAGEYDVARQSDEGEK